jgi:hypothetical protein
VVGVQGLCWGWLLVDSFQNYVFNWGAPKAPTPQASIKNITATVLKDAHDNKYIDVLNSKRNVVFFYRGLEIELVVTSLAEELVLKIAAWVKAAAVGTAALPEMKFEAGLFEDTKKPQVTVDDALVSEYAAARDTLARILTDVPVEGTVVVSMLKCKLQMLQGIDKTFVLEFKAWAAMHEGQEGMAAVQAKLMQALPTQSELKTLPQSVQIINTISQGCMYKFGNGAVKAQVDSVKEVLTMMVAGSPPAIAHMRVQTS